MRILQTAIVALGLAAAPALAQCPTNCATTSQHKPSSVIPADPGTLNRFGDGFANSVTRLLLAGNASTSISLGFNVNIGGRSFNSAFVNENGAISFGAAIGAVQATAETQANAAIFVPVVTSLRELGVPVIAPFYADLIEGTQFPNDTGPHVGEIFVQYGVADPTPDANGAYDPREALRATRITWYGLPVGTAAATDAADAAVTPLAFAQLLITDEGNGDFNFEFRSGDPSQAGPPYSQPGYGSIAGFALPGGSTDFRGNPNYDDGTPGYFAFRGGLLVTAVPEPASWAMMIVGLGFVGGMLRRPNRILWGRTAAA